MVEGPERNRPLRRPGLRLIESTNFPLVGYILPLFLYHIFLDDLSVFWKYYNHHYSNPDLNEPSYRMPFLAWTPPLKIEKYTSKSNRRGWPKRQKELTKFRGGSPIVSMRCKLGNSDVAHFTSSQTFVKIDNFSLFVTLVITHKQHFEFIVFKQWNQWIFIAINLSESIWLTLT